MNHQEEVKRILEEAETQNDIIRSFNKDMIIYYGRLEAISKQYRRRMPVRDAAFQEDFRETMMNLRKFADRVQDFWQHTRRLYNSVDKDDFVRENRLNIKQIKTAAASFSRQSDELYMNYKNLNALGKDLPLRLNWWLFESSCGDMSKISGNILFISRDMEKCYE
jgi:DNA gyrase/topoisomerase IV subunit A